MKREIRIDTGELRLDAETTAEGYRKGVAFITRSGVFPYLDAAGNLMWELRHPDDVFKAASLASAKMLPFQVDHNAMLDASNIGQFKVGHGGEDVRVDAPFVQVPFVIDNALGIAAIAGGKNQLSCGYWMRLIEERGTYDGQEYTHRQVDIEYNHVALCEQARLGAELNVGDSRNDSRFRFDSAGTRVAYRTDSTASTKQPENIMIKVKVANGHSYDASEEVATEVARLQAALDKALGDVTTLNGKVSTVEAERDSMKTSKEKAEKDLKEATDAMPEKIKTAAKDRAALHAVARKVLDTAEHSKLDGMTDLEVMRAVVKEKNPGIASTIDAKDETYIKTAYDLAAANVDASTENAEDGEPAAGGNSAATIREAAAPVGDKGKKIDSLPSRRQDAQKNAKGK